MIKARPEDFIVEEIASLPLVDRGEFRVYQLTKKNWTTPDLVHFLARYLSISPKAIAYGGKKDKTRSDHPVHHHPQPEGFQPGGAQFFSKAGWLYEKADESGSH